VEKLQREKLSTQIYALLKEVIADHRFQPGSRLNVESIARELDVSRTPVWEAVRRLEQEGLVEIFTTEAYSCHLSPLRRPWTFMR